MLLRYISRTNGFILSPGHEQVLVFPDCRCLPPQPYWAYLGATAGGPGRYPGGVHRPEQVRTQAALRLAPLPMFSTFSWLTFFQIGIGCFVVSYLMCALLHNWGWRPRR